MLKIQGLEARVVNGEKVLHGVHLEIKPGEIHAIMGPNGSGKSTLSNVIMGHPDYEVEAGSMYLDGEDLVQKTPDERALMGVFLAFQYPVSIPGVSVLNFLQTVMNVQRKKKGENLLDAYEIIQRAEMACAKVGLEKSFLQRSLNDGFSGGEKKRTEVLQMLMLRPKLVIMDETDSGLDIDSLKLVASACKALADESRSFLVVTHYKRLLEHLAPNKVHVFIDGVVKRSGDMMLANELERSGYAKNQTVSE